MRQKLGLKKQKRIEEQMGHSVRSAWTRGGWPHYVAEVWITPTTNIWWNYKEGKPTNNKNWDNIFKIFLSAYNKANKTDYKPHQPK